MYLLERIVRFYKCDKEREVRDMTTDALLSTVTGEILELIMNFIVPIIFWCIWSRVRNMRNSMLVKPQTALNTGGITINQIVESLENKKRAF